MLRVKYNIAVIFSVLRLFDNYLVNLCSIICHSFLSVHSGVQSLGNSRGQYLGFVSMPRANILILLIFVAVFQELFFVWMSTFSTYVQWTPGDAAPLPRVHVTVIITTAPLLAKPSVRIGCRDLVFWNCGTVFTSRKPQR